MSRGIPQESERESILWASNTKSCLKGIGDREVVEPF